MGVQILDPCTGTGNFIVNLLQRISGSTLQHKYSNDLFCNEIMLLPYYIASLNIEHAYYERTGEYRPFKGICFADTLNLEGQQMELFSEGNTERMQREKAAQIMVVIGNPPYNVGQGNENDNNKNRRYPVIDKRVYNTYMKDSKATNTRAVSDAYVKFFRWATDRLGERDGIICYISNNSFVDQIAFDGMRKHFLRDFTQIYHLDLHGNVRKNPKLSGTTHNVFGIQVGVGITVAIRASKSSSQFVHYYRVPEYWRKTEKLAFLTEKGSIAGIDWRELQPNERYTWITDDLHADFSDLLPLGTKEAKSAPDLEVGGAGVKTIFKIYSRGAETTRDRWMYDFDRDRLATKTASMIETYNAEISRWERAGLPQDIDSFVLSDETKIKWSSSLKDRLRRKVNANFSLPAIRNSFYRPFTHQFLYFDNVMTHRQGMFSNIFPVPFTEQENAVICLSGVGSSKPFQCLAANCIPDLHLTGDAQCFPYYTYAEDGSNRRENITDWALAQFQEKYEADVSKWDVFHYVYAMLHHPQYRERYAENLKRDLPHIPLLHSKEAFLACVRIGKRLMDIHLDYEQAREYPLMWIENRDIPFSWYVKKMKLTPDKAAVIVNESLTLSGIPQECFQYRLGNRSALEWVIDQYQVSKDKRSRIMSDPNRDDEPEYIVRLVGRVVTVSVETVQLVSELTQAVVHKDWMSERVAIS